MDTLTKATTKEVKNIESEMKKTGKKQKLEQLLLTAAVKAANKGILAAKKSIEKEQKDYAKLEAEMQAYIAKENKKTIEDVKKELDKA